MCYTTKQSKYIKVYVKKMIGRTFEDVRIMSKSMIVENKSKMS